MTKKTMTVAVVAIAIAIACLVGGAAPRAHKVTGHERLVGGPCEGCEAVFQGLPDTITSVGRIAPAGEPGEPLRIVGTVRHGDGTVAPGTIVYAYQTNSRGIYPVNDMFRGKAAYRHGMLRGWAIADEEGHYQFDTVRPAGYPSTDIPQHVHMHVIEPGRCTYYIEDIRFMDDPRLTIDDVLENVGLGGPSRSRGGGGVAKPERDPDGTWLVTRDITLGHAIPGYPAAGGR